MLDLQTTYRNHTKDFRSFNGPDSLPWSGEYINTVANEPYFPMDEQGNDAYMDIWIEEAAYPFEDFDR